MSKELQDDLRVINVHMTIVYYRTFIDAVIAQNQFCQSVKMSIPI